MKVGIVGSGKMGSLLGRLLASAGHDVTMSNSRDPESMEALPEALGVSVSIGSVPQAVEGAEVVILAVPWTAISAATSVVHDWTGRIVIDPTNNRSKPGPDGVIDIGGRVSSEIVQELVPGARVVKAFNTTPIPILESGLGVNANGTNAVYIAGDDDDAKGVVAALIASIGGVAVDTGDLATGGRLQGTGGPLSAVFEMMTPDEAKARLSDAISQ